MRFPLGLLGREESDKNSQASCSKQGEPQLVLKHDWSGRATGVIRFKPTAKDRGQHRSWKLQRNLERLWQGTEIGENFTELEIPRRNSANTLEFPVGLKIGLQREFVRAQRRIRQRKKQNFFRGWRYVVQEEHHELTHLCLQRHWKLWKKHINTNKASVILAERFSCHRTHHLLREDLLWWQQQAQFGAYKRTVLSEAEKDSKKSHKHHATSVPGEEFEAESSCSHEDTVVHKISSRFARRKILSHFLRQWCASTSLERPWEVECVKHWRNRRVMGAAFRSWVQTNCRQKDALLAATSFAKRKTMEQIFRCWMGLVMDKKLQYGVGNVLCGHPKNDTGLYHSIKKLSDWRILQHESAALERWAMSWHSRRVVRNVIQHWGRKVLHSCQEDDIDRMIAWRQVHIVGKVFAYWINNTREKLRQRLLVGRFQERHARLLAQKSLHDWHAAWREMVVDRSSNFRAEGHWSKRMVSVCFRRWSTTSRQNKDRYLIARLCSGIHTKTITKKALRGWMATAAKSREHRNIIYYVEKKRVTKAWNGWRNVKDTAVLQRVAAAALEEKVQRFRCAHIMKTWKAGVQISIQHFSQVVESFRGRLLARRCLRVLRDSAKISRQLRERGQESLLKSYVYRWSLSVSQTKSITQHLQKVLGQNPLTIQSRCLYTWRTALEQTREREVKDEERASKYYMKKLVSNSLRGWHRVHKNRVAAETNRRDYLLSLAYIVFSSWRNQSYKQFHKNSHALLEQVQQKLHSLPPISSATSTAHSQASSVRSSMSEPLSQLQNRSLTPVPTSYPLQTAVDRNPPL